MKNSIILSCALFLMSAILSGDTNIGVNVASAVCVNASGSDCRANAKQIINNNYQRGGSDVPPADDESEE